MLKIRNYQESDWIAIRRIHDSARMQELTLAGLEEAFLPLEIAAQREGLFDYPGLFVAEEESGVVGFLACTEEELAWLYVAPGKMRQGIGMRLSQYALERYPQIRSVEALVGNIPARRLYEKLGFQTVEIGKGWMPGNESFAVEVYSMEREV